MNSATSSISGTMDGIVYQNWDGNFSYNFPQANGNYSVRLNFSDWDLAAGQRFFDVGMKNKAFLQEFDNHDPTGQQNVYDVTVPFAIGDGMLDSDFFSNGDTAKINAILVKPIEPEIYTISASAGTGGSITPAGTSSILSGGSKSFTITPNAGSVIADVTVDGVSIGPLNSYTFNKVSANHIIQASFGSSLIKNMFALNCGGTSYTNPTGHAYLGDTCVDKHDDTSFYLQSKCSGTLLKP